MSYPFVTLFVRMHRSSSVKRKDGKFPIVLQVTWNRKVRRKRLGIYASIEQWDFDDHEFRKGVHGRREKNQQLEEIEERAQKIYDDHFEGKPFNYAKFTELMWSKRVENVGVAEFCNLVGENFLKKGQASSGKYYQYTGVAVLKVSPNDIPFDEFTEEWLRKFEEYFNQKGVKCYNYMVHLRSVYNKAVQKRLADFKYNPFKNPYTNPYGYNFSHLKKSKISQSNKDRIKDLTREQVTALWDFSDMTDLEKRYMAIWFFSFFNVGVNLIDIAKMKFKHIRNNRWYYERSKTGISLKTGKPLLEESLQLIDKYGTGGKGDDYVFPILIGYDQNEETITDRVLKYAGRIRHASQRIARRKGFDGYFTFYSARHSAATLLLNSGADRNTVSHLLDHENFSTIDNYAGRADQEKVAKTMQTLSHILKE